MPSPDKKKKGGLLSNALKLVKNKVKKTIKKETSKEGLKSRAADFVKGKVEDGAKSKRSKNQKAVDKATKRPGADIQISKNIELKDRKKQKQLKKIKQWNKQKSQNSGQAAFLALDKKFKKNK